MVLFLAGLVDVGVSVHRVAVLVLVLVFYVLMVMGGVRMLVRLAIVLMSQLVGLCGLVGVLLGHGAPSGLMSCSGLWIPTVHLAQGAMIHVSQRLVQQAAHMCVIQAVNGVPALPTANHQTHLAQNS